MEQWPFRRQCESAQAHQKKHVRSRRNRSAQASRAPSQHKEPVQKEQEEQGARTTGGSSEETEEHEKQHTLSAYHKWHQQGCVRVKLSGKGQRQLSSAEECEPLSWMKRNISSSWPVASR